MQETILLIQTYVRMVWRYRWVALVMAMLISVAGWTAVMLLPDKYRAETKVYLDTTSMLRPLLKGLAFDADSQRRTVQLVTRTLLSRPNLEAVVRKTDMDLLAKTPEEFERLLSRLERQVQVTQTRRDNIFIIAYEHRDPELATKVVDALLNIMVEKSLGESRRDTSQTKQFLDEQIKDYEAKLEAAEQRLKEFKQRNLGLMPGSGDDYFNRLQAQRAQVKEVKLQLEEAVRRRDELALQLENVDELFIAPEYTMFEQAAMHPHDARIQQLESSLDEMLMQYTEQHPDVIATRRLLERLEEERAADLAAAPAEEEAGLPGVPREQIENPMYQQLKVAHGEAQAVVASLEARLEEYQRREEELQRLIDESLKVETEFKALNRDYGLLRRNYQGLIERREKLSLSEEVSATTEDIKFNVIEPPRQPTVPTSPDRPLLNAGVLFAGLGGGIAFAWLLAMMRPAIYTKEGLEQLTQLPVLGVVSRLWTRGELVKRRLEVATFAVGCLCLLGLYAGVMTVDPDTLARLSPPELAAKLNQLSERLL